MRCEVCGAPVLDGKLRCDVCERRKSNSLNRETSSNDEQRAFYRGDFSLPQLSSGLSELGSIILDGNYRLIEEIGRGAMGTVFLAEDMALRRKVAAKFLLPELKNSKECSLRFEAEAIGMASIRDRNVVQIYSYATYGQDPYFIMEYLDGETVEDTINAHNNRGFFIGIDEVFDILIQSVNGLSAIHAAGAIHRDIKPANIMLDGDPARAVIMDFGLVRNVQVEDNLRELAGTPAYIAPELIEGKTGSDRSLLTDIYSMGITAYELFTGTLPFNGDTWVDILRKQISEMPAFPSERRAGLPEEIDKIILRAISKDPNERHQSCDELLSDLFQVKQGLLVEQKCPTTLPPPPRIGSRPWRSETFQEARANSSTSAGKRGRLLVADEDAEFRAVVHGAAKSVVPGCRVASASDGVMALRLVEEFQPNVVLLDLSLQDINGIEFVATLRGDSAMDHVKIVMVSSQSGREEAKILSEMGVDWFITKPIDPDGLGELLRPMLESSFSLSHDLL